MDNLSFELNEGQTLALVGESGSGKSTVVRALAQLVKRKSGEVLLDGSPAGRHGQALRGYRHRVQLVFQDPFASLNPIHTVRHQRQRVAIARTLATNPDVLLADEPVSMLDVSIRLEILNLLDGLKRDRNLTMLYVTHDLATARHFSSEIMVMYRGEIVERGPSDEVILRPSHPYTQILAGSAPDPTISREDLATARRTRQAVRASQTAEQREVAIDKGCRFRSRCPFAMDICATHPPDLAAAPDHLARCWPLSDDVTPAGAGANSTLPWRGPAR